MSFVISVAAREHILIIRMHFAVRNRHIAKNIDYFRIIKLYFWKSDNSLSIFIVRPNVFCVCKYNFILLLSKFKIFDLKCVSCVYYSFNLFRFHVLTLGLETV